MHEDRRDFLKQAGVAGVAVAVGGCASMGETPMADSAMSRAEGGPMPRGMVLLGIMVDGKPTLGVKTQRGILDVRRATQQFGMRAPTTVDEVVRHGDGGLGALVKTATAQGSTSLFVDEASATFCPCVLDPEKIVCVGLNYAKHARETNNPIPKLPILFNKYNNALAGHRSVIRVSEEPTEKVDYEVELVIVLGRVARNVSEADALSYVFGYCVGNDLSARDLQQRTSQWMIGKSLDGFAPIGPYLVTADQVPDPNALALDTKVNGEVRQSSNTADMVYNCKQLVAYASKMFTLRPGDLIFTGTPEGVISGYPKDRQVWLKAGDKLTNRIERLGELAFTLG